VRDALSSEVVVGDTDAEVSSLVGSESVDCVSGTSIVVSDSVSVSNRPTRAIRRMSRLATSMTRTNEQTNKRTNERDESRLAFDYRTLCDAPSADWRCRRCDRTTPCRRDQPRCRPDHRRRNRASFDRRRCCRHSSSSTSSAALRQTPSSSTSSAALRQTPSSSSSSRSAMRCARPPSLHCAARASNLARFVVVHATLMNRSFRQCATRQRVQFYLEAVRARMTVATVAEPITQSGTHRSSRHSIRST
jgi:hypothetical protein